MAHANGNLMRSFPCPLNEFDLIYHAIRRVKLFHNGSETSIFWNLSQ